VSINDQVNAIQSEYAAQLAKVRANDGLSDRGKRDAIAQLFDKTKARLANLREATQASSDAERRTIERRLFGIGSSSPEAVIAFRDAMDRVEACKSGTDAERLLERAERTDDATLGRAVLCHAIDQGWDAIVDTYCQAHPNVVDDVRDYIAAQPSRRSRVFERVQNSMIFSLTRPAELR